VRGHPGALWADASGMERRGGDAAVARALLDAARAAGEPDARVGVAGCCIAAAAATRERGSAWRVVPPGGDGRYLRRRSLGLVPMPAGLRASLSLLGLRDCGGLADLSAADVELRFGAEGLAAWRLARGDDPRWPFRPAPPAAARAEVDFEPPISSTEPLRFVLPGLVGSLAAQLGERQRVPAGLRLVLRLDGGGDDVREVRPARPTADGRVLADLCRRALEERPPGEPVAGVLLEAAEEGTARADQLDAFRAPAPDPAALHSALLPVFARWGDEALCRALHQGAHLPAEHATWAPLGSAGIAAFAKTEGKDAGVSGDAHPPVRGDLPLCLRRLPEPLPVSVRSDAEGRPCGVEPQAAAPAAFSVGGASCPPGMWKTRAEGPERVSGLWWGKGSAREYWTIEWADGCLGLLFRDAGSGGWYLEGWYD
jgi:protein ImuB